MVGKILQIFVGVIPLLLLAYGAALGAGLVAPKWLGIITAVLGAVGSALRSGIFGPLPEAPPFVPPKVQP